MHLTVEKDFAANKLINMYMLFDGADAVSQITQTFLWLIYQVPEYRLSMKSFQIKVDLVQYFITQYPFDT